MWYRAAVQSVEYRIVPTVFKLEDMTKGWLVGDFTPTVLSTSACEVAVKHYQPGDHEAGHVHRIASEVTVVVSGAIRMNGVAYGAGDIIRLEPGEASDFEALQTSVTVVVKVPSVRGDKYVTE